MLENENLTKQTREYLSPLAAHGAPTKYTTRSITAELSSRQTTSPWECSNKNNNDPIEEK